LLMLPGARQKITDLVWSLENLVGSLESNYKTQHAAMPHPPEIGDCTLICLKAHWSARSNEKVSIFVSGSQPSSVTQSG
jgi:hypothetical protein